MRGVECWVWGVGFGVQGLGFGFGVWGLGFEVRGLESLGFDVCCLRFGAWGLWA